MNRNLSLHEILRMGETYYLESLRESLEASNLGEYAVIDVERKRYVVDADHYVAIKKAQNEFGKKIFYSTLIGMLKMPTADYFAKKHAWNF